MRSYKVQALGRRQSSELLLLTTLDTILMHIDLTITSPAAKSGTARNRFHIALGRGIRNDAASSDYTLRNEAELQIV